VNKAAGFPQIRNQTQPENLSLHPKPFVLATPPYGSTTPCRIVTGAEIVTLPLGPVADVAEITDAASSTTRSLAVMLIVPP
jgi:hypothetical protein